MGHKFYRLYRVLQTLLWKAYNVVNMNRNKHYFVVWLLQICYYVVMCYTPSVISAWKNNLTLSCKIICPALYRKWSWKSIFALKTRRSRRWRSLIKVFPETEHKSSILKKNKKENHTQTNTSANLFFPTQ